MRPEETTRVDIGPIVRELWTALYKLHDEQGISWQALAVASLQVAGAVALAAWPDAATEEHDRTARDARLMSVKVLTEAMKGASVWCRQDESRKDIPCIPH